LLDGAAPPITIGVALIARRIFATLAGITLATKAENM
jgi:hypothetical protein